MTYANSTSETENLNSQSHLQGCYSLLASNPIRLDSLSSLARAAFWNYLREDITVALIERRKLMIELSDEHIPRNPDTDDDYANVVTILLGQVINNCFGADSSPMDQLLLLENSLEIWKDRLPSSFTPILNCDLVESKERAFPFMGTLHGWHGTSIDSIVLNSLGWLITVFSRRYPILSNSNDHLISCEAKVAGEHNHG